MKQIQSEILDAAMNQRAHEENKKIIANRLLSERKYFRIILYCHVAVLEQFKEYALLHQGKEPRLHKLHADQIKLMKTFLSDLKKMEYVKGLNGKKA